MDFTKVELTAVECVAGEEAGIGVLNDLELALIGGGCGEVVFG